MKKVKRICAFYSHGPHYLRLLRYLRENCPDAEITAMAPPDFPDEPLLNCADHVMHTGQPSYSLRDVRALRQLLRQIRSAHYDLFAIMFDSPKLRLLATLSGVRRRYCYTADGRFFSIHFSIVSLLAQALYRNIRGRITYAYIRHVVYHRPVEKDEGGRRKDEGGRMKGEG